MVLESQQFPGCCKKLFIKLNKYGADTADKYPGSSFPTSYLIINAYAWGISLWINDRDLINEALKWMLPVIEIDNVGGYLDTYAALLYRIGRKEEAIEWQEKALQLALKFNYPPDIENFKWRLEKMKKESPL